MSTSDALVNLVVALVVMPPLLLLSWWVIRKTPLQGLSGTEKWRAYRIRFGAGAMLLIGIGLTLYFLLNLISGLLNIT